MTSTPQALKKGTQLFSDMPAGNEMRPLFRWLHGVIWLALLGFFVVCHGCHGDEDNELAAAGAKPKAPTRAPPSALRSE
jgi:hypothetical protein